MEATRYDPAVIQEFADSLYAQATRIVFAWTALGVLIGFGGGCVAGKSEVYGVIGAALLGVLGHAIGTSRAFLLKLQAQTALCQVKIEQNTSTTSAIANEQDCSGASS